MPNDVKAIVSIVVLIVAACSPIGAGSPIRHDFSTWVMATAAFMVVAMWVFPEAGVKKGDYQAVEVSRRGAQSQRTLMPPSTTISVPVTKRASSEARNSAALAVSRPSPAKPTGCA